MFKLFYEKIFLYKKEIIFFLIGLVHYIFVFNYTTPYSQDFEILRKVVYFSCKILSFIIIIGFWQLIPFVMNGYKKNNKKIISFTRYTLFYWLINLLTAYFTYPTRDYFSGYENIWDFSGYYIETYCHFLNHFIPTLNYNILPVDFSSAICSTFIYSLIFAFCIFTAKEKISSKYYFLMIIPFCFPLILIYNLHISRSVYAAWLFVFISFYIIYYKNKILNNYQVFVIAFLSGILASFRLEYTFLFIVFPIVYLVYKFLNIKNIIAFLLLFIMTFAGCSIINKSNSNPYDYALDNLIYVYVYYYDSPYYGLSDADYNSLKKVFRGLDHLNFREKNFSLYVEDLNSENIEDNKKAISILSKILLSHPVYYMKTKILELNYQFETRYDVFQLLRQKIRILDHKNDKNYSYFLYGTDNCISNRFFKILYNPILNYILMFLTLLYGLKNRNKFFIFQGLLWLFISIIVLLTVAYCKYLYYFPQVFNSWVIFFVLILDFIQNQISNTKNRNHSSL